VELKGISIRYLFGSLQESVPGLELRSQLDAQGLRPQDYAQRTRNPVLMHLLDERLPVALLRQVRHHVEQLQKEQLGCLA
jgi:hypothetical protein